MSEEEKNEEFVREIIAKQQWYEAYRKMKKENEKLQKENEELRDTNKKLYEMGQQNAIQEILNEKWISKDKIRNKIKELEEIKNQYNDESMFDNQISVLQELLEEE